MENTTQGLLSNTVAAIILAVGAFVIFNTYNASVQQANKNNAIAACVTASTVELKNTDNSSWKGPNQEWFERCVTAQGYEMK